MGERRITCAEGWAKWDSRLRSLAQRGKKKKSEDRRKGTANLYKHQCINCFYATDNKYYQKSKDY